MLCSCKKTSSPPTPPPIENNKFLTWAKTYGGSDYDFANSMLQTSDGGYIIAGATRSNDGDLSNNYVGYNAWVLKIDANNTKLWSNNYGGFNDDYANSIVATSDGGYLLAGYTFISAGVDSAWARKIDGNGAEVWQKHFNISSDAKANAIVSTTDGGYIIVGSTVNGVGNDGWALKLDGNGNQLWSKTFGGVNDDNLTSIAATGDGTFLLAGYTKSINGDFINNNGGYDGWVIKIDASGNKLWNKIYGGNNDDVIQSIIKTPDGGYAFTGYTKSTNGDITKNNGDNDEWLVKIDAGGNKQWSKTFGGSNDDRANALSTTQDGGYIVTGYSNSTNGDVTRTHGDYDGLVLKTDASGNMVAISSYGGNGDDYINTIIKTSDGGYLYAGFTFITGRGYDAMLTKTQGL
jgi:hypothetical protein